MDRKKAKVTAEEKLATMLSFYEKWALYRSAHHPMLAQPPGDPDAQQHWVVRLGEYIKPPARVLDVGCGSGALLLALLTAGYRAEGITLSEAEIQAGLPITHGDFHDLAWDDGVLDAVICIQSLEHALCPIMVIREMHRVLREDGMALIEVPASEYEPVPNPEHFSILTARQWHAMLERWGFELVEMDEDRGNTRFAVRKPFETIEGESDDDLMIAKARRGQVPKGWHAVRGTPIRSSPGWGRRGR